MPLHEISPTSLLALGTGICWLIFLGKDATITGLESI